jgi:hypothetical protein
MSISEQKRQKKLAEKKKKRTNKVKPIQTLSLRKAKPYSAYPIHECLIPDNLFTSGIGELLVSRRTPNGDIALSSFVLDVFCLGVKDAMFILVSEDGYDEIVERIESISNTRSFEKIHQSCAKKLLEGAVEYARNLGFSPHSDYLNARDILNNVDLNACPVKYTFGKNGKPFYINGPNESENKSKKIIDTLTKKCGEGNFDYSIMVGDENDFDDFLDEDDFNENTEIEYQNKIFKTSSYTITFEPLRDELYEQLPDSVKQELEDLHEYIANQERTTQKNSPVIISRLQELMEQYPHLPVFSNYLSSFYKITNDSRLDVLIKENYNNYPDYLFARIQYAEWCLDNGQTEKVSEIFKEGFDLKFLYPERDVFHISEFTIFSYFLGRYFFNLGDEKTAKLFLQGLKKVVPDHRVTHLLDELLNDSFGNRLKKLFTRGKPANFKA